MERPAKIQLDSVGASFSWIGFGLGSIIDTIQLDSSVCETSVLVVLVVYDHIRFIGFSLQVRQMVFISFHY
jgi:hypothetical protein